MAPPFLDALRAETSALQTAHPILRCGLDKAFALVASGAVFPEDDGTSAMVQSQSDPTQYHPVNGACDCKAAQYHEAPCAHRLAFRLYQKVCDRLAAEEERYTVDLETPAPPEAPAAPLPEAPASVNVRLVVAGRDVQWTLRDTDEERLAVRLDALLARYPIEQASPLVAATAPQPPVCNYHGAMKPSTKGNGWYCPAKMADGTYCKGKAVQP
jgi:hypothetical protein